MQSIYYISQGQTPEQHLKHIEMACRAGCRLIQLRLKQVSESIYLSTAKQANAICKNFGAALIINDNIEVAIACDADGIHVGQSDTQPKDLPDVLKSKLIGGTANTLAQCQALIEQGVDYIGLGPFRHTDTKSNLSPILGIDGFKTILNTLKKRVPIVAIGGIQVSDFRVLYEIGIYSIAVSGILSNTTHNTLKQIIETSKLEQQKVLNLTL